VVNTNPNAFYARTTVYHQGPMRKAIKEAIEWPGFAFIDIASQCIENNGRRIGFGSAYEMLEHYKTEYKPGPRDATHLERHQLGIVKGEPATAAGAAPSGSGNGE
jgi:pyruvate/2-oxoacid:ferredoxin oxidoreductase beta subunit